MEQVQSSSKVAGIDVGKARLDVAVHGLEDATQATNDARGFSERMIGWTPG